MLVTQQPRIKTNWSPTGRREVQDYYVVREAIADYSDYWGTIVDPDGKVRDRESLEERLQFASDIKYLTDFVNDLHPESVLDFGAGPGWLLAEINAPNKDAVEIAPQAAFRLDEIGVPNWGELSCVPSNLYDVVIAHHVIEHLIDPLYAINHVRRVLKYAGWLILGTPDFASPCAKRFGANYRMLHDKTHCSLFTLESCSRMLRDYGFTIERVTFPFPERYATAENFLRWNDTSNVSPPWPGNWMTFYARRA